MALSRIDKFGFLWESRLHDDFKSGGIDDWALCSTEHLFFGNANLFDTAVVEFTQLTFKNDLDVLFAKLGIDLF